MDIFIGVIVGLVVLMILVVLHEFGHFWAARKNGVNVPEFGIGFPPRAIAWVKDKNTGKWRRLKRSEWTKDKVSKTVLSDAESSSKTMSVSSSDKSFIQKGMIFSINWLPIGGFCQMDGESAADKKKGTFGASSFLAKTKILFAGVAMNWTTAIIIFTILAWVGMPEFLDNQFTIKEDTQYVSEPVKIVEIAEGSPAEKAGLKIDDKILGIGENSFTHTYEITDYNEAHAGEEVMYKIAREKVCEVDCEDGATEEILDINITLNPAESDYLLGVAMESKQSLSYSTWSAPIVGIGLAAQLTGETFKGVGVMLWDLVTGIGSQFSPDASIRENGKEAISSVGDSVSGPVGIIGVLFPAFTAMGPANLAFLAAIISISLACMNVLPIPALDGGRWLLIAIYKLRKKELTKEVEEKIVSRAFMVLLALIFIVTILDIIRLAR
ncbi:MAG: M50 family metallopeptidase [Candidatus Saccharibacteria bacterium]|nr:M50 family metallopeptidase [Candidatus Saccharibacteria bacterium]